MTATILGYLAELLLNAWAKRWLPGFAALLLVVPGPVHADIYKCKLANGRTEISNAPCPSGSGTVAVRPDDTVSEEARAQAERDVARMRGFVEQREAEQRREAAADQQHQAEARQAAASQRVYDSANMDDCLRELGQQAIDGTRRSELEAICRAKPKAQPTLVPVPVYGSPGSPGEDCVRHVLRLHLPAAEQERRIAACRGVVLPSAHKPTRKPTAAPAESTPAPTISICPRGDRSCVR